MAISVYVPSPKRSVMRFISAFAFAMSSGLFAYAPTKSQEATASPLAIGRGLTTGRLTTFTVVVAIINGVVVLTLCSEVDVAVGRVGETACFGDKNCVTPSANTIKTPPIMSSFVLFIPLEVSIQVI